VHVRLRVDALRTSYMIDGRYAAKAN